MNNEMDNPILSFQWKDYTIAVFSIDEDDGFVFSAIDYCGDEWNEKMGSKEETELYNFTMQRIVDMNTP